MLHPQKSAPCERILKPHCREGAGAATRASHHTDLCEMCFPNTYMILLTIGRCYSPALHREHRGWVWGNGWQQWNPRWKRCKEGQQGPLWGQKGEQLTWAALTTHHPSSFKEENGKLNGLLGCSTYKGQRAHQIMRHPEDSEGQKAVLRVMYTSWFHLMRICILPSWPCLALRDC